METITTIKDMSSRTQALRREKRIGFVPTMGYLHKGHLRLLKTAKSLSDVTVLSIYVNPSQFGPGEDYSIYPRDLERDHRLAEEAGADFVFQPPDEEMYPPGYQTWVSVDEMTRHLCGATRPGHFRGVTTVVTKLFNIVRPHLAVFGQKDAQQALVIKRMVRDLNIDVDIVIAPTVRETDGLAISSRNKNLTPEQRRAAPLIYQALQKCSKRIQQGNRDCARLKKMVRDVISENPLLQIDYVECVDPDRLQPLQHISTSALIAVAVRIGKVRLVDNIIVDI
jgi:pantoate--beta-alanine ligase